MENHRNDCQHHFIQLMKVRNKQVDMIELLVGMCVAILAGRNNELIYHAFLSLKNNLP